MLGWSPGRMAIWWLLVASAGIAPPPLDTRAVAASAGLTSSPLDTRGHALRLRNDGFTVLPPSGLTESQVAAARTAVSSALAETLHTVSHIGLDPTEQMYRFSEVATRQRRRWDLKAPDHEGCAPWVDLCDAAAATVAPVVDELMRLPPHPDDCGLRWASRLGRGLLPVRRRVLSRGAIVSRPGASAQRFHADNSRTHFALSSALPRHRLFNAFVPLVDIAADADGTQLWPGSHLARTRARRYREAVTRSGHLEDDERAMGQMVSPACSAGGILLFDARTLHRGLPNAGPSERPVAYALCATGLAWDGANFPPNSLLRTAATMPTEPAELDAVRDAVRGAFPYWSKLKERETDGERE